MALLYFGERKVSKCSLPQYKDEVSAVAYTTTSWNSAVRSACNYFIGTGGNRSQAADFTANKFAQLRNWVGSK